MSVPYALKALDAQTISGLPPSAFVLAAPPAGSGTSPAVAGANSAPNAPPNNAVTGTGKVNFIPLWDSTTDIISSALFQSGTGTTAKIGINTTTPASTLDVKGGATVRGTLSLPSNGTATATTGKDSQPLSLAASAFNSGTGKAVAQTFEWQAQPVGNDTSNPSGTLNLLFGSGTTPTETGLNIGSNGQITFASGQTFPGTGTITGLTAGTDLTGGGTSGNVTLNVDTTKVPQLASANTFTANQTVSGTVTATSFSGNGSGLTNVNATTLGSLSSSAFAQLAAANVFTANQTVNGSLTAQSVTAATGIVSGVVVSATGGAVEGVSSVIPDVLGSNNGTAPYPGLLPGNGGEGVSSARPAGSPNQYGLDFWTDYKKRMSITNSGLVGIGTASPQYSLDINGGVDGSTGMAIFRGYDNFQKANDYAQVYVGDTSHGVLALNNVGTFLSAYQEPFGLVVQDATGFVGIGVTNPNTSLVIKKGLGAAFSDGWYAYSSRRWKTNIHTLHGALEKVERLRGVSYGMKDSGKHQIGVIAEEVGAVVPELVDWEKNGKDARGVDYARLTALLIEATKEQQVLIHKQQHQLKTQQVQIANLNNQVRTIQTALHESGRTDAGVLTAKATTSFMHP
jgi:hypothetical protein